MVKRITGKILSIGMITCFSFCMQCCFAQTVQTSVDRNDILIGEQLKYNIKASFPSGSYKIDWFTLPDSVAHFEVVDRGTVDSTVDNNTTTLQRTITYTSFDSGRWNTPALPINFTSATNNPVNVFTDSIPINVMYSPADSTGQLRDIKPIMEVTIIDYFWYYIAGGILLLLIIIYLLWRYFKNRKPAAVTKSSRSAYDDAMKALEKLKQYDLNQKEEIKAYHTGLSNIFREYMGHKQNKNLLNSTSSDVLISLSSFNLDSDTVSTTAAALRTGDAVKFAKYIPSATESEEGFENIKRSIQIIEEKIKLATAQASEKK